MWLGLLVFVAGAVFLLQRFDLIPAETWHYLWPILLLVFGIKMMASGGSSGECEVPASKLKKAAPKKKATPKKRKVAKKK